MAYVQLLATVRAPHPLVDWTRIFKKPAEIKPENRN